MIVPVSHEPRSLDSQFVYRCESLNSMVPVSASVELNDTGVLLTSCKKKQEEKGTACKKTVRWSEVNNSMRYTLSFELYSDEELESCWYAEEDYTAIRRSCSKQIKKMNEGKELKDKKYCSRGLETYTKAKNETKKLTRRLAIDVVLYEQDRQRGLNIMSEEIIAQNYMAACASSQMLARNLGLGDQKAAEE